MSEQWKPIEGYGGKYEVSNLGRVRQGEKSVNQYKDGKGYLRVSLYKDGAERNVKVHRLVALAFIPNPENLPMVNHKDEVKTNNRVDNLEWCDNKYNCNYGTIKERLDAMRRRCPVIGTDKDGNEHRFASIKDAADYVGGKEPGIGECIRRLQGKHSAYGYRWRYEDEELNRHYAERAERMRKTHDKPVIATDKEGKEIYFHSIKEAVEKTGAQRSSIIKCCKGYYGCHHAAGYSWRYANQHNV